MKNTPLCVVRILISCVTQFNIKNTCVCARVFFLFLFPPICMRGNHSFYERFVESRQVYDIPVSNLLIVLTIVFVVVRNAFYRCMAPVAWQFTNNGCSEAVKVRSERESHDLVAKKVLKYFYHFLWFSCVCPWSFSLAWRAPWFDFTYCNAKVIGTIKDNFYGMMRNSSGQVVEADSGDPWTEEFNLFMVTQLAWYMHDFIEDTLWDRKRADYILMVIHHLVTILLIGLQFQADGQRGGLYVILPMDLMDYILYGGKLFHAYSSTVDGEPRGRGWRKAQNVTMCGVFAAWVITRLYMYGSYVFHVIWAFWYEDSVFSTDVWKGRLSVHLTVLLWLAVSLLILQIIWGVLILKIVLRIFITGKVRDNLMQTHRNGKKDD